MADDAFQQNIWAYFQNPAASRVFADAQVRHRALLRAAARLTPLREPHLLNIGVGDGYLERTARTRGWHVASLDPDDDAMARLRQDGIDARTGSITDLPFGAESLDAVIATEVLEHLGNETRERGLREIHRVLKSGGHLLGTVPHREDLQQSVTVCPQCSHVFHRWGHTTSFDLSQMRAELTPHFSHVDCRATAFVEFRGVPLRGKLKNLARLALAKMGSPLVWSNILFIARK